MPKHTLNWKTAIIQSRKGAGSALAAAPAIREGAVMGFASTAAAAVIEHVGIGPPVKQRQASGRVLECWPPVERLPDAERCQASSQAVMKNS
jgi:hypothetical protein